MLVAGTLWIYTWEKFVLTVSTCRRHCWNLNELCGLQHYQFPGFDIIGQFDIVLQLCKMLQSWETGWRAHRTSLYICLWRGATSWESISSVQSFSGVRLFVTPWIAARQASLSITNSRSSLKLKSTESVMPSSHLILGRPLLLLPPIPPSIESFPMSHLFAWGGQSTGVSALASFPPKKSQGWSPSEWTGWISLQSKDSQESSPTPLFPNKKLKKKLVRYCMRGEKVSIPLTRMEEALGPDNTHMVKALLHGI